MRPRQPLPRLWLMTDERQGDSLWPALERLPRGAGVVFRHYDLSAAAREALLEKIRRIVRRKRLTLIVAGSPELAQKYRADGIHNAKGLYPGLRSASVHDLRELRKAVRGGADLVFLSPVFATRSHPGGRTLGPVRAALLARRSSVPVIALGGMNEGRARMLRRSGFHGWAAIDAWAGPHQKRKAVPM